VILFGDIHDIALPKSERTIYRWINTSVFNRDNAQQLAATSARFRRVLAASGRMPTISGTPPC